MTSEFPEKSTMTTPISTTPGSGPSADITARISDELRATLQEKMEGAGLFESEDEKGHHHAERHPSIITAAASGLVNFLLMFGMCCAYGIIIFSDTHNRRHVPTAIKMNLSTSLIIGLLCATCSKVPVAIGGPDINPAVFLGLFVEAMAPEIAADLGLGPDYPDSKTERRRLTEALCWTSSGGGSRRLAGSSASDFCTGQHEIENRQACQDYHDQLIATTIFATALSTLVLGCVFLFMGSMKLTRYMAYVPTSIMEAFLACVGYKVFAYAVSQAEYEPSQFVPAAIIGITMYFLKAKHIGNPAILMPLGFLLPLGLFFAGVYSVGADVDEVRKDNLMFPKISNVDFWEVWTASLGSKDKINFQAWTQTLPDFAIMIIVVTLDCVLKVVATDSKMPLHVDKDYEVKMHGVNNLLLATTGSAVGYMQLKFNVINYGIIGNVVDRKAGLIYALLCGACYLYTIEPFNYLPRFFISSLLFFAGSGFVAENLWGSRGTNSPLEWLEILLIVVTFILTGQLVIAVTVGGILCFITFIMKYAKVSVMDGLPMRGGDLRVVERRGPLLQRGIRHVTDNWLLVIRLKGYIFFASADTLTNHVYDFITEQQENLVPEYRRLKFVVFDCSLLDGMDASAAKAMKRLAAHASKAGVRVLWSHLTPAFASELRMRGLLTENSKDVFNDVEEVVIQVEHLAKAYLQGLEDKWVGLHPAFRRWQRMTQAQFAFEPFTLVFLSPLYRIGNPWQYCALVPVHAYSTLLFTPGQSDGYLYLVHSGAVALFQELPAPDKPWGSPVAIYRQGWFLNREILMRAPSRFYAVAIEDGEVLCWNQDQWWRMACERPLMMSEMLKTVMKQQARDSDNFDPHAHDIISMSDDAVWEKVHEDLILRQQSVISQGSDGKKDHGATPPSQSLPEEVQVRFAAMETAQALENFGFYSQDEDTDEEAFLPDLPHCLKADIDFAFKRYSKQIDIRDTEKMIDTADVHKAVMYAGLFHHTEAYEEPSSPMGHDDFMKLCHRGWMEPFRAKQVAAIRRLFGTPAEGLVALTLSANGLQRALRKVVPSISAEMTDAYFMAFREHSDLSAPIDLQAFTGIMSLLVRLHRPYWDVAQACREILGANLMSPQLQLDWKRLVFASHERQYQSGDPDLNVLSEEEAEEMLWSSDWRLAGRGEGKTLGCPEFTSAVLATFNREAGPLPNFGADGEEDEIFTTPSAVELTTDLSHFGLEGNIEATMKNMSAISGHVVNFSAGLPTGPKSGGLPSTGLSHKQISAATVGELLPPDQSGRVVPQSAKDGRRSSLGKLRISAGEWDLQKFMLEAAVAALIFASTLALVLEPIISGKDSKQEKDDERLWLVVEVCITALLTMELLLRFASVVQMGFLATGVSQVSLVMDMLATLPLYFDGLSALFEGSDLLHDGLEDSASLLRVVRMARVSRFASKTTIAAPVATMLVVVWGIYVKHGLSDK